MTVTSSRITVCKRQRKSMKVERDRYIDTYKPIEMYRSVDMYR